MDNRYEAVVREIEIQQRGLGTEAYKKLLEDLVCEIEARLDCLPKEDYD